MASASMWRTGRFATTGLVSTTTTPMLLELDQMMDAYDTFARAAETKAMKVAIAR